MSATEALQITNKLLREDADYHSTRYQTLTSREREALVKLSTLAQQATYGRRG